MKFNPYDQYKQDWEAAENERLEDELFNDEMRAEAQKALEINLDEGLEAIYEDDYRNEFDENGLADVRDKLGNNMDESVSDWLKNRGE